MKNRYVWLILLCAGLLACEKKQEPQLPVFYATDYTVSEDSVYNVTAAETVPDFTLINQDGDTIRGRDYQGKIYVIDFFFTSCPDICKVMSKELSRVQTKYKDDPELRMLSVTIDPIHDSLPVLKAYAGHYGAIHGKWEFATGIPDSIFNLAGKHFKVPSPKKLGELDHSDRLILVDRKGWIRGYYSGTDPEKVEQLIKDIKVLKDSYAEHQRK